MNVMRRRGTEEALTGMRMMQKRVVVSFRGGNTNDDDESVMACGGVMFSFNNARWPIGIGTGAVVGHATSGRSSERHAVFKKEGRTALHGELFLLLAREYVRSV